MKIFRFENIPRKEWDAYVKNIPESTYMHTSWWIDYLNAVNAGGMSKSFILLEGDRPLVICPMAFCKVRNYGAEYMQAAFGGASVPYPAIARLSPSQRRKTVRKLFSFVDEDLRSCGVKRVAFTRHPINLGVLNDNLPMTNMAEAISFGYFCHVANLIIIDLKKGENDLFNETAPDRRRHIRKSKRQQLEIKEYNGGGEDVDNVFNNFQAAHFHSAERMTRSVESWDLMRNLLKSNMATLFTACVSGVGDISYLYCGEFDKFAFIWSQVNISKYEKEYSPRHLLEWEVMMSCKKKGFRYYGVGPLEVPSFTHIPTSKEMNISYFRERYGGNLYPYFSFEKFFEKDLLYLFCNDRIKNVISSEYFFKNNQLAGGIV